MHDWTGSTAQIEALTVPCSFCHSPSGTLCVGLDGKPLEAFPSHTVRSTAARAAAAKETE